MGDFTYNNTIQQTSARYSNWLQNWCPTGRSQRSLSLTCITHTRNQTTLGLAVKLQHKHGCSELIRLLHDHGVIVSYDEVIRFRKSAAKFVGDSDRNNILHQAMGLSWRVWPIFGLFDNLDLLVSTPNGRRDTHVMAQEFEQHPSCILETGSAQPESINLVISYLLLSASRSLKLSNSRSVPLQHYTGLKKVNPL